MIWWKMTEDPVPPFQMPDQVAEVSNPPLQMPVQVVEKGEKKADI